MKREKTKPVILGRVVFLLLTLMSPLIIFGQANGQAYNHPSHPQRAYKSHPYKNNVYKVAPTEVMLIKITRIKIGVEGTVYTIVQRLF